MTSRIRIENDPLTPELLAKAENELRETPERVKESVEQLRKLLKEDKTIYYKDTDEILVKYLRPVKFYPESAIELMRREAAFKDKHKAILENLMPVMVERAMVEQDIVNVLVDRDHQGRRIMLFRAGKVWNTSLVSSEQVFQMFYLIHQGAALEPATQVNGVVVILDFEGMGMSQVMALNPTFSMRLLTFIQEAMPLRLKEVHIVNEPFIFNLVWKIFKPLIKEKLNKRLHFHGYKFDKLHKFIPPEYLPDNYKGQLPKMDYSAKDWYPILRSLDPIIEENNTFGLVKS